MADSSPLASDQDIFVDINMFFAIGALSNMEYQAFCREVARANVILKLPRRVVGELDERKAERVRTALEDGWVEIIDAPPIRDANAVNASDIARRTMADKPDAPNTRSRRSIQSSTDWRSSISGIRRTGVLS